MYYCELWHYNKNHDRLGRFSSSQEAKLATWKEKETVGVDKRYSKIVSGFEKDSGKAKRKYEKTGKEKYKHKQRDYDTRATFEKGMMAAEKQFIKNATYEDMKKEKTKIAAGYTAMGAVYAASNVTLAAVGIPFFVIPLPAAVSSVSSGIKRHNRIDSKRADEIYRKAQRKNKSI